MTDYQRPALSAEQQRQAAQMAARLIAGKSTRQIVLGLAGLLCENMRLTLECNQHRAARGLPALPTVVEE